MSSLTVVTSHRPSRQPSQAMAITTKNIIPIVSCPSRISSFLLRLFIMSLLLITSLVHFNNHDWHTIINMLPSPLNHSFILHLVSFYMSFLDIISIISSYFYQVKFNNHDWHTIINTLPSSLIHSFIHSSFSIILHVICFRISYKSSLRIFIR